MKLTTILKLTRAEHSLLSFVGIFVGELAYANFYTLLTLSNFFALFGPALITGGAFALNDYFGYESDKKNKRFDRPIVSGDISKNAALALSLFLFLAGFALVIIFSNLYCELFVLLLVLLALIYDKLLKPLPLAGNFFIAFSMCAPFIYGNLLVSTYFSPLVVLLLLIVFFVGVGRELIITIRDVRGDRASGAKTLPILIGKQKTSIISSLFILFALVLTLVPFVLSANVYYLVLVLLTDLIFAYTIYLMLFRQSRKSLLLCRDLTLFGLFLGLISFLALFLFKA